MKPPVVSNVPAASLFIYTYLGTDVKPFEEIPVTIDLITSFLLTKTAINAVAHRVINDMLISYNRITRLT